jgi:hypothetical protein
LDSNQVPLSKGIQIFVSTDFSTPSIDLNILLYIISWQPIEDIPRDPELFVGHIVRTQDLGVLTINICIKVCLDLQVYKSSVVVKGTFLP